MQSKDYDDKPSLDYLFHPRSVAIAGVSGDLARFSGGRMFLQNLINAGYKGKIYPVNPSGGEVLGLKIYPNIKDIPDTVDYVISAIPAQYTPQLVADCADKRVKAVHMFTSGFSEIGDEEEKQLEWQIATMARQKGIRIIGPNCMGLYCPKGGLSFGPDLSKQSGCVGYISQSGGNSLYGVREAATRGVYFSKVISYGNACDLNETNFLEYFTHDPETKIIAAYIEGVKDGRRFFQALKQATRVKPVIIYKGGSTESGTKAVASHTGSIAGSERIWDSLLKQAGAIQVDCVEEIVDMALLFSYMAPPKGRNVAVIGVGGGISVIAADACSNAGLTMPILPPEVRQKLKDVLITEAGRSFKNPVDIPSFGKAKVIQKATKIVADCEQIDLLIIHIAFDIRVLPVRTLATPDIESIISLANEINKRTAVVLHFAALAESKQLASDAQTALSKAGFPVYPSISRAANAISKFIQYHHRQ